MNRASLGWVLAVLLLIPLTLAFAPQESKGDRWIYLAVRVPSAVTLQTEFREHSKVDAKIKRKTDIDSLGEDGWEMVSVVPEGEAFVCFFKRRR